MSIMIGSIVGYSFNKPIFKQNLHPVDLKYKQALIEGIQDKYQFKAKLGDLKSVIGPYQFKEILKKLSFKNFSLGKFTHAGKISSINDFENIIDGTHCVNLHIHTNNSDGNLNIEEYLKQASKYGNKLNKLNNKESFPYYISSVTDHNNINGVQETVAKIADETKKYKNFKFVPGCEFMFLDENSGFKYPAFEALGYCFNPFDNEIAEKISIFNSIEIISKIKSFGGIVSYAHPVRHCQGNGIDLKFLEYLKKIGINGIESNYQYINFKNSKDSDEKNQFVQKYAKQNRLWETGGTDVHSSNIFHHKAQSFLDELI